MVEVYLCSAIVVAGFVTTFMICVVLPVAYEDDGPRAAARLGLASIPGVPLAAVLWPLLLVFGLGYGLWRLWRVAELPPHPRRRPRSHFDLEAEAGLDPQCPDCGEKLYRAGHHPPTNGWRWHCSTHGETQDG